MFTMRLGIIISIIVVLGSIWFSNSCDNRYRLEQTFVFIENSTYTIQNPGNEFLFRAHFSNRLPYSGKERYVIYFIDPLTFAATVLKNSSFDSIIGYRLIEETLVVQKDGVLLLKISLHPSLKNKSFDSVFALAIVNVTEPHPPLTKEELEYVATVNRILPYFDKDDITIYFPNGGRKLKTLQLYQTYKDGIMKNYNYGDLVYNNYSLKNMNGLANDVSAYNYKDGRKNYLINYDGFFFLTYEGDETLYIKYIGAWYTYWYHDLIKEGLITKSNPWLQRYEIFSPLQGYGQTTLDDNVDLNEKYFFKTQAIRRELYKDKGFLAFQGCGEGEYILFNSNKLLVWGVVENGTKRVVNFKIFPYDSEGDRIDTWVNKSQFPIITLGQKPTKKNKVNCITEYVFLQTYPRVKNLKRNQNPRV